MLLFPPDLWFAAVLGFDHRVGHRVDLVQHVLVRSDVRDQPLETTTTASQQAVKTNIEWYSNRRPAIDSYQSCKDISLRLDS